MGMPIKQIIFWISAACCLFHVASFPAFAADSSDVQPSEHSASVSTASPQMSADDFVDRIHKLIDHGDLQDVSFVEKLFDLHFEFSPISSTEMGSTEFYMRDETKENLINQYKIQFDRKNRLLTEPFWLDAAILINAPKDVCVSRKSFEKVIPSAAKLKNGADGGSFWDYTIVEGDKVHVLALSLEAGVGEDCVASLDIFEKQFKRAQE